MITYCKDKYTNWVSHLSAGQETVIQAGQSII